MSKHVIAIDGPAASGKGTLARALADKLGFAYMDTGALYRGTAFELLSAGLSDRDQNDAAGAAKILMKRINNAQKPSDILDNKTLREDKIGQQASKIAAYPKVREVLNKIQRSFAEDPGFEYDGAILDGRDIGTVICPNADLKLYITASTEIRAQRRLKELQSRGISTTYEAVLTDMRERDARDSSREAAPMKPAGDAITIDSSDLDADQMLEKAANLAKDKLGL